MHLRSLSLKGFKSFPDRTLLEFAPGVSVIVGPNGSGKSNVTDAVLWAMGEQSPLAVRGQSMQDVIFAGGRGVKARSQAEVELVLDNSDGTLDIPSSEISILRRLDRNGEGEYRLNGARCRLVDVLEVLSDTGLGKEMHSVVSQGRVEAIVTSKPKDRRLLIEEAAGLGKHRKRRRRAQLKLLKTEENLARALDIEREARTRLKPLKRQAEAAESHARIERQATEARWDLAGETLRRRRKELVEAEAEVQKALAARDEAQRQLAEVAERRLAAEVALEQRTERRETLTREAAQCGGAADRIELRLERTRDVAEQVAERLQRREHLLDALRAEAAADDGDADADGTIAELERQLAEIDAQRATALEVELEQLRESREQAGAREREREAAVELARAALADADAACEVARSARREAEQAAEAARRESARVGAELAKSNQFLRTHSGDRARSLADDLEIESGLELALAAALGGRLSAAVTDSRTQADELLDGLGVNGGHVLVTGASQTPAPGRPPVPGARSLAQLVAGPEGSLALARHLLRDAWVVESLEGVPDDFAGIAVTPGGRAWSGSARELLQAHSGGSERVIAERNRRDSLTAEMERVAGAEHTRLAEIETARSAVSDADERRYEAERALRGAEREHGDAVEQVRRAEQAIEARRRVPEHGESAVRHAQLSAELAAARDLESRIAGQREQRARRIATLSAQLELDRALVAPAAALAQALTVAATAVRDQARAVDERLAADRAAGEHDANELRTCAAREGEIQTALGECSERVTRTEVRAQQLRDAEHEAIVELELLAQRLGLPAEPRATPLPDAEAEQLRKRIERLERQRESLGPVNPLAKREYDDALAAVTEMEAQRADLETALRELKALIRDTDREISQAFEETFEAAARNFESLAQTMFPGGRGRLRLVTDEKADEDQERDPGDGTVDLARAAAAEEAADAEASEAFVGGPGEHLGVEIEITPAGKSMKRLTLLSGGEKSMTALAFLFAVFLAKPCPFYILDEVEAALDDANITRFLDLLRAHAHEAQFIVVTHQKRTMDAADTLYGVSMGGDGVSKVISRRLPRDTIEITASRGDATEAIV